MSTMKCTLGVLFTILFVIINSSRSDKTQSQPSFLEHEDDTSRNLMKMAQRRYSNESLVKFSIKVTIHDKVQIVPLNDTLSPLIVLWGAPRLDELTECKDFLQTCAKELIRYVQHLSEHVRGECNYCDIDSTLRKMSKMLIIRLSDSVHYASDCRDRTCLIKEVFRMLRFLLNLDDQDDQFDDCEKCAIGDLLILLKQFLTYIRTVALNPRDDLNCNADNWNCLLRRVKRAANTNKDCTNNDCTCEECGAEYSCKQCLKYRDCDYCHRFLGCSACLPDRTTCDSCIISHECRYCQRLGCNCNLEEDCVQCLTYKECGYCRENYACRCVEEDDNQSKCKTCLERRDCKYCRKQYGCDCGDRCEQCMERHDCDYCRDKYGCDCGDTCEGCMERHDCDYCRDKYGCKCKKQSRRQKCEKCLETRECDYCQEQFGCDCEGGECRDCLDNHNCQYCKEKYGCLCKPDESKCKKCLETRLCDYCQNKYGCYCKPPTTTTTTTTTTPKPKPNLPICRKCFEPRTRKQTAHHTYCGGNSYTYETITWQNANDRCVREGYKLASVRTPDENTDMLDEIKRRGYNNANFWLAAQCSPHCFQMNRHAWYWSDSPKKDLIDSNWTMGYWDNNKPSRNDDVAALWAGKNSFKWNDDSVSSSHDYMCERPCDPNCAGGPQELQSMTVKHK